MNQQRAKPVTHHVDVDEALATLDYSEMLALAEMFERWALTEQKVDGTQRTKLVEWSSDYETIAAFAGSAWVATDRSEPPSLLAFLARRELAARS